MRRQEPHRVLTASFAIVATLVLAVVHGGVGCDDAYEAPCKITAKRVVVTDAAISSTPNVALARSRGRAVASWPRRELVDAGPDATAAGVLPALTAFEVAVIDERGELGLRTAVPTPDALRLRRDGVEHPGVVVEDDASLIHWIETTTTTEPDGRARSSAALKVAYVTNGAPSPPITPARGSCEHCLVTLAFVGLGTESVALLRIDPDVLEAPFGSPVGPAFVALRFRRDGSVVDAPTPWLALPPSRQDAGLGLAAVSRPDLSAFVDAAGLLVITSGGSAWLADEGLRLIRGPVVLPSSADAHVSWEPSGEASVVWSISPFEDGRSESQALGRDVFAGLVPAGTSVVASRERVSDGRAVLAAERNGNDVGILFESAQRLFFASVEPRGKKRGGDVLVTSRFTGTAPAQSEIRLDQHLVFARGDGRFGVVALGTGELATTEIVCAP